jgi:inhibitor of KinA sporulation pathway (predicted exonuclease)
VDLEATCWEHNPPAPNEIIEIGAVAYDLGGGALADFQTFVKPHLRPTLSPFCKELTSIQQRDVDGAPGFPEALASLCAWAEPYLPFTLAAWGNYDRNQFEQDCELHEIEYPFIGYVNIKQAFARLQGVRPCGMKAALRSACVPLRGTHHRGIDDVRNIASLVDWMLHKFGAEAMLAAGRVD